MEEIDHYKLLFEDSFTSSLVFYFSKSYVFDTLGILQTRNNIDCLIYYLANLLAMSFNYLVGFFISRYVKSMHSYRGFIKFKDHYNKYIFLLMVFTFVDLWGGLIALVSGLTGVRYIYCLILSSLGLFARIFYLNYLIVS